MNKEMQTESAIKRSKQLFKKRNEILSLPPEKAIDAILDNEHPAAVVHSFTEQDFYFLINDIGLEDSLMLLSLASNRQWEYILDVEVWERDRLGIKSATRWFDLLFKSDSNRFIKWFLEEKTEVIEFYLFKTIDVMIREHDQEASDFGEDFFTIDNVFYIRFADYPFDKKLDKTTIECRNTFLSKFIRRLSDYDHVTYQNVLLESAHIIPAEAEEEAFRLRNVRLAEKGFLPFEEAGFIYKPIDPQALKKMSKKFIKGKLKQNLLVPAPLYPLKMLQKNNLFAVSLALLDDDELLQEIHQEFASLSNQIVSADQKKINNREGLRDIVKKACGYISIGLERLTEKEKNKSNPAVHAAKMMQKYPLTEIFRVGYGGCLKLKWRAEKWRSKCWFEEKKLPLSFWGEEWLGVLGGILIKKPFFFDNYKTGVLYREFLSTEDIKKTEKVLNKIIAFDFLLSLMTIKLNSSFYSLLSYKNLVLTLWARNYLGLSDELLPIDIENFKRFYDDLFPDLKNPDKQDKNEPLKIKKAMKELFLNWLSDNTGLSGYEVIKQSGQALEELFFEIESEYRFVSKEDLDPKYVYLFLLHKE